MKTITDFAELFSHFKCIDKCYHVAIVSPDDEATRQVVERCLSLNNINLFLIASGSSTAYAKKAEQQYSDRITAVEATDVDDAARKGVALVREGKADVLMKGTINTDNLLRAVLDKQCGLLPSDTVMSHITVAEIPGFNRLLIFSDAAVIPRPTLAQLQAMIRYDIGLSRKIGNNRPKVALIHFTEKVNIKFPHTLDYVTIKEQALKGEFGSVAVDGPMDVKTACDLHSGQVKGIASEVVGNADILIFPNLEAGNTFYKTISCFANAKMAGILSGTTAPVVIPSRADSDDSKFNSLILACISSK